MWIIIILFSCDNVQNQTSENIDQSPWTEKDEQKSLNVRKRPARLGKSASSCPYAHQLNQTTLQADSNQVYTWEFPMWRHRSCTGFTQV